MWMSVRAKWCQANRPLEGRCNWMYSDVEDLVTTGMGDLMEPVSEALALTWVDKTTGMVATAAEVQAEWQYVKSRIDLEKDGGYAFEHVTRLRLSDASIDALILKRLDLNDRYSAGRITNWATWPADAQMGWLSICWAAGPAARYPKLLAAAGARDWYTCERECNLANPPSNPHEYDARNALQHLCFDNAAAVEALGLNPAVLYWPGRPSQPAPATSPAA